MTTKTDAARELWNRFRYHPPVTNERLRLHEKIRNNTGALAEQFLNELPDGREKSLAITKLEEAMMWANAAVARQPAP